MADHLEKQLRDAARPSVRIVENIAVGTSTKVHAMLIEISTKFWHPRYTVGRLKKDLRINFRHIRRFRAATGISPSRLIRECRMETGMRLLRDSLLTVEDIAILIGYDCQRSLGRVCRRWCGFSPAQLRKKLRAIKPELSELPDDVSSWYFWQQYYCNGLSDSDQQKMIEYFERLLAS